MGYSADTQLGRVFAGETDTIFRPRTPRKNTFGCVLLHGSSAPQQYIDPTQRTSTIIASTLSSLGIPCISGEFGGQTFGAPVIESRIDSARNVLSLEYPNMNTSKIALLGISMGGCNASFYAINHASEVAAMIGIIPLLDLKAFYTYFPGTPLANDISDAWGIAHGAALPPQADNKNLAPAAANVPLLVGYASDDPLVHPEWVTGYTSQIPGATVMNLGPHGHTDASVAQMPISTISKFLIANGC